MANTKISALTTFTGDTTGVYVVIDNSGLTQTYKVSIDALLSSLSGITSSGNISGQYLISTNATGNEGGEVQLAKPPNSTLSGGTTIDAYVNQVRIFEQGGNARGVSLDLSKAPIGVGGELMWKASNYVNAGTFVTLDNLKATLTSGSPRGLSLATVSGSITANIGGTFSITSSTAAGGKAGVQSITTTASTSIFAWDFTGQADTSTYIISDTTNSRVYRIILMIGGSYLNNFISIERLY